MTNIIFFRRHTFCRAFRDKNTSASLAKNCWWGKKKCTRVSVRVFECVSACVCVCSSSAFFSVIKVWVCVHLWVQLFKCMLCISKRIFEEVAEKCNQSNRWQSVLKEIHQKKEPSVCLSVCLLLHSGSIFTLFIRIQCEPMISLQISVSRLFWCLSVSTLVFLPKWNSKSNQKSMKQIITHEKLSRTK